MWDDAMDFRLAHFVHHQPACQVEVWYIRTIEEIQGFFRECN